MAKKRILAGFAIGFAVGLVAVTTLGSFLISRYNPLYGWQF